MGLSVVSLKMKPSPLLYHPLMALHEEKTVTGDADTTSDDSFSFDTEIGKDFTYTVTVTTPPTGKICVLTPAGMQTMGDADATVAVSCVFVSHRVEGSVSGLAENETVTLTLTPTVGTAETEVVTGDANTSNDEIFSFDKEIVKDVTYTVTATSPPTGKACTVAPNGEQIMGDGNATITVICAKLYNVSGTVTGHIEDVKITLENWYNQNSNKDVQEITVDSNTGTFSFSGGVQSGNNYSAKVSQDDNSSTVCTFTNTNSADTSGTMPEQDVTLSIQCIIKQSRVQYWFIGDDRTGEIGMRLTFESAERGRINAIIQPFQTNLWSSMTLSVGEKYRLSIQTQPPGMTCTIDGGTDWRTMGTSDVTVNIDCKNNNP